MQGSRPGKRGKITENAAVCDFPYGSGKGLLKIINRMKSGRFKGFLKGNNIRRKLCVILIREDGSIVGILCQI